MLENILQKDRELLIALNNLGSESFDYFWLTITNQFTWIPLFATVLFFVFKKLGLKKGIFTLLFIVVLVAFSDQLTNFMKNTTERLRPCNAEELRGYLRQFSYKPGGYSFWSGHASLSTTFSVFIILIFYRSSKYILLLTVFPILFGYSRIYLGVHYPSDVLTGYISGILIGFIFYFSYKELYKSVFKEVYT
ncbi:phosphatase PAP2 family protein [Tenacibaculum sp. 190524A02b]|uniref:phosphatase PAP2 family protein n=1 Tax=Tenacibaculum vairaonense TaxID=3137860 RepID=UPI0031FACA70